MNYVDLLIQNAETDIAPMKTPYSYTVTPCRACAMRSTAPRPREKHSTASGLLGNQIQSLFLFCDCTKRKAEGDLSPSYGATSNQADTRPRSSNRGSCP